MRWPRIGQGLNQELKDSGQSNENQGGGIEGIAAGLGLAKIKAGCYKSKGKSEIVAEELLCPDGCAVLPCQGMGSSEGCKDFTEGRRGGGSVRKRKAKLCLIPARKRHKQRDRAPKRNEKRLLTKSDNARGAEDG